MTENDPVDGGIAKEAVYTLNDEWAKVLDEGRMRTFDEQRQRAACLLAGWESDRFRQRHLGIALTDDLGPATDDCALDESESPKGLSADGPDELPGGAWAATSRGFFLRWLSLRHGARACHSDFVTANLAERLLQHYVDNFRRLPWRSPPGGPPADPYRVWLSEVMLQQTTVGAVIPRFERFLARWPTIEALAAAADEEILAEWAGLGYYARARNLIACARKVASRGGFPSNARELRQLPGVGAYTSAAIGAIAFREPAPAIDTNIERIIARLSGLKAPRRAELEQRMRALLPTDHPGDFTQAMMDLGAMICRPRNPFCNACPLKKDCTAFREGTPEEFPAPRARRHRPHKYGVAYWIERDTAVWLVRRPARGLLGGMAALPGSQWGEKSESGNAIGTVRHVFTHFSLDLQIAVGSEPTGEGWWHPVDRLGDAGLPSLYQRAVELVLSNEQRRAA